MNAWLEAPGGLRVQLRGVCSIGRASNNTLVIDDHRVSRRHALIHAQGVEGFHLVDLGSSNGVVLNEHAIKKPVLLKDGDRIQIAESTLTFRSDSHDGTESAPADQTLFVSKKDLPHQLLWLMALELDRGASSSASRQLDPAVAGQWLLQLKDQLEKFGGSIYRFSGTGCVGFWRDAAVPFERIASAIAAIASLPDAPAFHTALHLGEVVVDSTGVAGDEVLLGSGMTTLARIERWAASNGHRAVLSADASIALQGLVLAHSLGRQALSGPGTEQEIFQLVPGS